MNPFGGIIASDVLSSEAPPQPCIGHASKLCYVFHIRGLVYSRRFPYVSYSSVNFNQLVAPFPHRYREEISAWHCRSCRLLRESTALRKYAQVKLEVLGYRLSVTLSQTTLSGVALSAGIPPL